MTPARPYLLRAMHQWITDNDYTPYILVNTLGTDVAVPDRYVVDGKIVLNVSYSAVRDLVMENDALHFSARFDGRSHDIYVPVSSVEAVYAKENGQGMVFNDEDDGQPPDDGGPEPDAPRRPTLSVVK
ncbi:MAG: ClpXP protease specificity-enhancing factor [Gammaproteobacteria bacterium]|nr:ClpXP protease specificity-enhancing factor [Gammaproteobacteria bacterium]